ncbi:MAG: YceK/YidQ family lipoprotein [Pseudomonadota bacterium]
MQPKCEYTGARRLRVLIANVYGSQLFYAADIPLSILGDTILLPYDL